MKVLLIGGGGREHALAWKIAKSPLLSSLTLVGAGDTMAALGTRLDVPLEDVPDMAVRESIDLVVVGPEQPLADGIADRLTERQIPVFGPSARGAQIEASKAFMKELARARGIPVARSSEHGDAAAAKAALDGFGAPYVIKADGLAAGKGVIIAPTRAEAEAAIDTILGGAFGDAGKTVLVEEFLEGREVSAFVLSDGATLRFLGTAEDYKRAFDGETGPNTGGMGGVAPSPLETPALRDRLMNDIFAPLLAGLRAEGIDYRGCFYGGIVVTADGPKLIEVNCRFGDPECQLLMRRLRSDLLPLLWASATGRLAQQGVDWIPDWAANIVMATKGYPGAYEKGSVIIGVDAAAAAVPDCVIFHAGTRQDGDRLVAQGGRVLNVTTLAPDRETALLRAYEAAGRIEWADGYYRTDIGCRGN